MREKIPVGILGCTGNVGQKLIALLTNHPWFKIVDLVASEKSAKFPYGIVVNWRENQPLDEEIASLKVKNCYDPLDAKILFSGLASDVAGEIEQYYAERGHVVLSNSKNHRMDDDVPLIIPEINVDHLGLLERQKERYKGRASQKGCIVTNPNCVVIILAIALYPIFKKYGLQKVLVTTMQAISGAGYPGVASMDILGNVIPYIQDEEGKIEMEIAKVFGTYSRRGIIFSKVSVSALCNRVPVYDGHLLSISFSVKMKATRKQILDTITKSNKKFGLNLPSSPEIFLDYMNDVFRPQPLLDAHAGRGMTVSIGRLRRCNVLDWKMTALGHNTIRGAAGAAILNAEYMVANKLC